MVSKWIKRKIRCQRGEKGANKRKILLWEPRLVEMRNAFSELEEEVSAPATGLDKERKERANADSLPQGGVLVLGTVKLGIWIVRFVPGIGNLGPGGVSARWGYI